MTFPTDRPTPTLRARLASLLRRLAAATLLVVVGTGLPQDAAAQEPAEVPDDADAILDRMVENLRGGGQRATLIMRVERGDDVREYRLEVISDGTERSLTRVAWPPRDAGQAFLVDGDELFVYSPRLGRALRLPPSGRSDGFLGSDLSYDDMAGDEIRADYDADVAGRDDATVTLSLIPHPTAPTPYGELRFTASLPDLAPLELLYFDQRGEAVKRLTFSEIHELADGTRVPTHFEVVDLTADGGRTIADWTEVEFGVEPPDRCFTQQALERGCDW